jgi:hypothetical protein
MSGRVHRVRGESFFEVSPGAHLLFMPWYAPWLVPVWVGATWLATRPVVRGYRRRLALFEAGGAWRGNDPELRARV